MSHAAIAAVLAREDLAAGERLVAFSLASFANREQLAWPGLAAATTRGGLGRSRYLEAREQLVGRGLLEVEERGHGRGRASTVRLLFAQSGPWWPGEVNADLLEAVLGYSRARGPSRLLLAALAALSDGDGVVEGHLTEELCRAAGLANSTYRRARMTLLASGEVEVDGDTGGRGRTSRWTVRWPSELGLEPVVERGRQPAPPRDVRPLVAAVAAVASPGAIDDSAAGVRSPIPVDARARLRRSRGPDAHARQRVCLRVVQLVSLLAVLHACLQPSEGGRLMVICVANQKGGVGKTTTAVNLAVCLARGEGGVLAIDCDPQATMTRQFGIQIRELGLSLVDVLAGRAAAQDVVAVNVVDGVDVIPAARELSGVEMSLVGEFSREHFLADALESINERYAVVLIDTPPVDTVMTYAKLYPTTLVEAYRKAVRGNYESLHGPEALRNPTAEEWAEFTAGCNLRDMGTHLCSLPTGDHCSRGLVCLGCTHAQPKKSAAPIFRRMLSSHRRSLAEGERAGEPAGQLASRRLEIQRIEGGLGRAEQLPADVAAMIEGAAA